MRAKVPRQPECTTAKAPGATSTTGTQSAKQSRTGTPGAVHTTASAPAWASARTRASSASSAERATTTWSPCTCLGSTSLPAMGAAPTAARARTRFSATDAGSSPQCEPRLRLA